MEEKKAAVSVRRAVARLPELRFVEPVDWTIGAGEHWAVIGPNGSGKTLLADLIRQHYALKEGSVTYGYEGKTRDLVKSIAFKDIYSLADCRNTYYQQRWHATETDEIPVVEDLLKEYAGTAAFEKILDIFHIREFLPKKLIFLSSGELRKFLIVRTLLTRPRILILDNPFIGLDAPSRILLADMLQHIGRLGGIQVILLLSDPNDIPGMITHVLPLYDRTLGTARTRSEFLSDREAKETLFPAPESKLVLPEPRRAPSLHRITLRMEHVSVRYGSRTILKNLDWEVKNGEKWALSGPNGAGKSTLLSLVYADNPQSYANTLYLFDRKRGSGESIWEIKERIGYVSPEMHLYYMENVPVLRLVGSGFFDSVGLYRKCNAEQETVALAWMRLFGIEALKDRGFLTLSSGEQRLALLTRAFVKDPDLLILDEPLHGLDVSNKRLAARIIETFCRRPGKTLIYVTHYPEELPACVDKRFVLEKHA